MERFRAGDRDAFTALYRMPRRRNCWIASWPGFRRPMPRPAGWLPHCAVSGTRCYVAETEAAFGANHARVGQALQAYAAVLKRMKHDREAKPVEQRARQILAGSGAPQQASIDVRALLPRRK